MTSQSGGPVVMACDAGPRLGIGHVMRCLALGEECRARGYRVVVVADVAEVPWARSQLVERGFEVRAPAAPEALPAQLVAEEPAAVVLDSYRLPHSVYATLRAAAPPLLALVDGDPGGRDADYHLDQNIGAEDDTWPLPTGTVRLAGLEYALMRDGVREQRPVRPRAADRGDPPRVLAFFGGTDAAGAAPAAVRALVASEAPWQATVVAADAQRRNELAALSPGPGQELSVIDPTPGITGLVAGADAVISAAGTSSWELCCLGAATAYVCVADNQRPAYDRIVADRLGLGLGGVDELVADPASVAPVLRDWLADPAGRAAQRRTCWHRVDGQGRARVADALLGPVTGTDPSTPP